MSGKPQHRLVEFDSELFTRTNEEWERQLKKLGSSVFPSEVRRVLAWAASCQNYTATDCAYAVVFDGDDYASAIVEVVYHRNGASSAWLKMLDVTLAPAIDAAMLGPNVDLVGVERVIRIFAASALGAFKLTGQRKANVVKLYGRNGPLLTFLKVLGAEFASNPKAKDLGVSIEGRWLVFKQPTGGKK